MRAIHNERNSRFRARRCAYAWASARFTVWLASLNQRLFLPQYPRASRSTFRCRRRTPTPRLTRAISDHSRCGLPSGLPVRQQPLDPGHVGRVDPALLPQRPFALGSLVDHEVPAQLAPPQEPSPAGHPDPLGGALVGLELSHYVLFGAMIMIMLRPSINGCRSTTPKSANSCAIRRRICSPTWGCAISLPRNHIETRTLSPTLRNPITALVFTGTSCSPIFRLKPMPSSPDFLDSCCAPR